MTKLPWIDHLEKVVGANHPTATDVMNRPLRELLTRSGYDPDADPFPGLTIPVFNALAFLIGSGLSDTEAIQAALNAAKNAPEPGIKEVVVPDRLWLIDQPLLVYDNTRLRLGRNAVLQRNAAIDNMLRNGADGVTGGYAANQNIEVVGGTFDMNAANFAVAGTAIGFGHCTNVTVRAVTVKNVYGWHHIEFNAVKHGRVIDCTLQDYTIGSAAYSEAVQIDLALGAGQWPWFGPYDNTPCTDIEIRGNKFTGSVSRAVGTHSSAAGVLHTKIAIRDNVIENCQNEAINMLNWSRVSISDNDFDNCYQGVHGESDNATVCSDFIIQGNRFHDFLTYAPDQARAIWFQGLNTHRTFQRGVVRGNVVKNVGRHGITIDYGDDWAISGNTVSTVGSASAASGLGISFFSSSSCSATGNTVDSAWDVGIYATGGSRVVTLGNVVRSCGNYGIKYDNAVGGSIGGNSVSETTGQAGANGYGIGLVNNTSGIAVTGNNVRENQGHGIYLTGVTQNTVSHNEVANNSRRADLGYSGIMLTGNASTNNVQGNLVRSAGAGNRQQYGINIATADCNANLVTNNDLLTAGITAVLNNAGTGTITAAGNRAA